MNATCAHECYVYTNVKKVQAQTPEFGHSYGACAVLIFHFYKCFFSKNGVVAPYRNADRQKAVNKVAYKYGTGTGTAYKVRDYNLKIHFKHT